MNMFGNIVSFVHFKVCNLSFKYIFVIASFDSNICINSSHVLFYVNF